MEKMTTLPEEPVFNIETNLGTIKIRLYSKTPKHRDNFEKLALTGFYDSLLFHRVINGFMIQGGDPYTRDTSAAAVAKYGQGGPGYTIPAEFVPEYTHKKGAIAAARRGDIANPKKESSGSQFYIVQDEKTCAQLNGEYTVFGETISGFEVIDRIASVATNARDLPLKEVRIKKVTLDLPEEAEGTEKAQE
ncbi:MAG: peptidylprolyl isomerase [Candidatus Cryptobacteroides sp.]